MVESSLLRNALMPLAIPTYDGSGQCVHPDVIRTYGRFFGAEFLMVVEPYPFGDARCENPAILCSQNALLWRTPNTVPDPLVDPPRDPAAWHSDGDLLLLRDGRLALFFRFNSGKGETTLLRMETVDGRAWSGPQPLAVFTNSGRFASPALVDLGSAYGMIFVDTIDRTVCVSLSEDSVAWSPSKVAFAFPKAWHLDAVRMGDLIFVLLSDGQSLYILRTGDLRRWQALCRSGWTDYPLRGQTAENGGLLQVLAPRADAWDAKLIYRSSLLIEDGRLHIWYGAVTKGDEWRVAYTAGPLPE